MKLKKILQISIWRTNKVPHFSLFIRNNSGTVRRCSRRLVNNCTLTARDIAFSSHPLTWKTRADLTNYSVDGSQRIKIFRQRWLHTQHNGNWGVPVDVALDTSIWGDYELKTFAFGHYSTLRFAIFIFTIFGAGIAVEEAEMEITFTEFTKHIMNHS